MVRCSKLFGKRELVAHPSRSEAWGRVDLCFRGFRGPLPSSCGTPHIMPLIPPLTPEILDLASPYF